jgi:DNA-binding IclR family transcriptional regulator
MTDTSGTVARTLAVLTVLAECRGSVGVKEVAAALRLPMSTSHRMLDLLREAGFVEKDESRRRYRTGLQFLRVANLVAQGTSYAKLCQPSLDRIAAETGETTLYSEYVPDGHMAAYAAKSDSKNTLRYQIELFEPVPIECGASGLAILAFLREQTRAALCVRPRPSPVTGLSVSSSTLMAQVEEARRMGYALSRGQKLPDSIGIAVPVKLSDGRPIGSLTLTIPESRYLKSKLEDYVSLLFEEAKLLSNDRIS